MCSLLQPTLLCRRQNASPIPWQSPRPPFPAKKKGESNKIKGDSIKILDHGWNRDNIQTFFFSFILTGYAFSDLPSLYKKSAEIL